MELAYERRGSGEPLVLIHGLGGTKRIWGPVLELLAAERDVIAVDLPGFGRLAELPAGIAAERRQPRRRGQRAAAPGSGSSGPTWRATRSAPGRRSRSRRQGRAASVCAISPAGLWRAPLGPRRHDLHRWARRLRPAALRRCSARREPARRCSAGPSPTRSCSAPGKPGDWSPTGSTRRATTRPTHEMRSHVFEPPDGSTVPTTIAWGSKDRLVAPPRRERMPPGSRYRGPRGLGHTPTWDDPERVAELLLEASSRRPWRPARRSPNVVARLGGLLARPGAGGAVEAQPRELGRRRRWRAEKTRPSSASAAASFGQFVSRCSASGGSSSSTRPQRASNSLLAANPAIRPLTMLNGTKRSLLIGRQPTRA